VRILNGAHTALVGRALPLGFVTVREAVSDPAIAEWLERLLFTEIVPTMEGRAPGAEEFARHTLERFRNPFVEHNLKDIALYHEQKVRIRLMPTAEEYMQRFGRTPPLMSAALQGQGK
jgi:tagaturonate reductase